MAAYYTVSQHSTPPKFFCHKRLTDFQNSLTGTLYMKFAIVIIKDATIPQTRATLPCKILMSDNYSMSRALYSSVSVTVAER